MLRENSACFEREDRSIIPVRGYSCWALGYLDKAHQLIGCLLHPEQNGGEDLRYRIDYGEKCRREVCQEEKTFSELDQAVRIFWLHLADGLDSFSYSSRRINPLFTLMNWGVSILNLVASQEKDRIFSADAFFRTYPFFTMPWVPRAHRYLLRRLISGENCRLLKETSFGVSFKAFAEDLSNRLRDRYNVCPNGSHVHRLDLDRDFTDFLRLSAGIVKSEMKEAVTIKGVVDEALADFLGVYIG
jgi:hypothetical protein